ncbi:MAG: hypothetical protein U9R14_03030 [Patescibacteria group bacterium]|nr:hypothetical protein [Patescibacteria group bacterium]
MPKSKTNNKQSNSDEIKVNAENKSSVAEFIRRPLPDDKELEDFEEQVQEKAREEEIKESLSEIYHNDKGSAVNVRKFDIKKKRGFLFWFFSIILTIASLAGVAYAIYYYYYQISADSEAVEFSIEGKDEVMAGEDFFWTVNYKNLERVDINNIEIKLTYPENFIFLDSEPAVYERNNIWRFDLLAARRSGIIKIKGKLIGQADETAVVLADLTYTPANFSSEFKKSVSMESVISGIGVEFSFVHTSSILVGKENEIIIKYKAKENNYLNSFRLTVEPYNEQNEKQALPSLSEQADNIEFIAPPPATVKEKGLALEYLKPGVWLVNHIAEDEQAVKIKFQFKEKIDSNQDINLKFENSPDGENYYLFAEKNISFEVIKSDLDLNLIINGKPTDQGVDFGQTLHYSIVYANKGETEMKDIVIMAVLESDFLDWTSLDDKNNGRKQGNTISWSKEEILELKNLAKDNEGAIDFSIKLAPQASVDLSKDYWVKSYIQYSISDFSAGSESAEEAGESADEKAMAGEDTRSNIIINKINSDLKLNEQARYFNDDNMAVGTGPMPPKVGETTSFKVYWVVTNNLHELADLQVAVDLPSYVQWDNKSRASVGAIQYNSNNHQVVWQVGRLPIAVYRIDAEFNISVRPSQIDKNKIMVLLPGSIITAKDSKIESLLSQTTKAKTTKLEDDEIAEGDGRVVE